MNFNAVFVLTVLFNTILLFTHTAGMQQLKKELDRFTAIQYDVFFKMENSLPPEISTFQETAK
jgi:hypothetical protein